MQPNQVQENLPGITAFDRLVESLRRTLGPSSGIDSSDVDIKALQDHMTRYASEESEWKKYAFGDPSRGYTRNLVDHGNGKSNLVGFISFLSLRD